MRLGKKCLLPRYPRYYLRLRIQQGWGRIRIFNQQIEGTVSIIKGEARVKEELTALGKYDFHGGVMNI